MIRLYRGKKSTLDFEFSNEYNVINIWTIFIFVRRYRTTDSLNIVHYEKINKPNLRSIII